MAWLLESLDSSLLEGLLHPSAAVGNLLACRASWADAGQW